MEDRFRVLFEHSSDPHLIFDQRAGITDCNRAAIEILGARDRWELLALHPAQLSPPRQPCGRESSELSAEMDGLARERGFHRFEWTHRKLDGTPLPVDVTLNAVEIAGREAMIVVWHDLTERKRLDAERARLTQRLIQSNRALESANRELQRDLEAARAAQRSLLPGQDAAGGLAAVAWTFRPCETMGGDLLGVFPVGPGRLGFYVFDVSGHGVESSLYAVAAHRMLLPRVGPSSDSDARGHWRSPAEAVDQLNRHFCANSSGARFITLFCGILDARSRRLRYVCAGHPPPMVLRGQKTKSLACSPGLPVGVEPEATYEELEAQLAPGDRLLTYTDCAYEARDAAGEFFGQERLARAIERHTDCTISEHVTRAEQAVLEWCADADLADDLTFLGVEIK